MLAFTDRFVTIRQGLEEAGVTVRYEPGCGVHDAIEDGIENACAAVYESNICVLCLGEDSSMSGESASVQHITLPAVQLELLENIAACHKPVILLLTNGRPLLLSDILPQADAVVETWFLGHEAGHAISDVLLGHTEPTGHLTMSFPVSQGQIPVYYNHMNTGRPHKAGTPYVRFESNYMDGPNEPLFPFGFGLSYSSFGYSDLRVEGDTVRARVTNTGKIEASEVAQLYISPPEGEGDKHRPPPRYGAVPAVCAGCGCFHCPPGAGTESLYPGTLAARRKPGRAVYGHDGHAAFL